MADVRKLQSLIFTISDIKQLIFKTIGRELEKEKIQPIIDALNKLRLEVVKLNENKKTDAITKLLEKYSGKKVVLKEMPRSDDELGSYSCLNTSSKISTKNPMANELVSTWENEKGSGSTYLLLRKGDRRVILSGSGTGYTKVGKQISLFDDGNGTTKFPSQYDRRSGRYKSSYNGLIVTVEAIAEGAQQISKFPPGTYQLYVMK